MENKQNIMIDRDSIKKKFKLFLQNIEKNAKIAVFSDKDDIEYVKKKLFIELGSNYKEFYTNYEEIGQGTLGIVKKTKCLENNKLYAVKIIKSIDDEIIFQIKNEFKHLYNLNHENIIKVYQLLIDSEKCKIYLVMEYFESIELFDYIIKIGNYNENITKNIFKQLLNGINFLHNNGIVHRDLKPNNILISEKDLKLKITDFNIAKFTDAYNNYNSLKKDNYKMLTYTGTLSFNAPEIFSDGFYTELVDMWSAGCILYTMLIGKQPFSKNFVKDLIDQIKNNDFDKKCKEWFMLTKKAQNLIENLLVLDINKRYNSKQALNDLWFTCEIIMDLNYCSKLMNNHKIKLVKNINMNYKKNKTESFSGYIKRKTIESENIWIYKKTIKNSNN